MMASVNGVSIVARTLVCALLVLALRAAEDPHLLAQVLAEFHKTKPAVSEVHVIAETPLLVAATGQHGWAHGDLLGIFARRGEQLVSISVLPNEDLPTNVWIDHAGPDSITLSMAEYERGLRSVNLEIFFDPKTYFPRRIVRFAPVQVRRIALVAGVLTLSGSDEKQDFTARERNGAWHITTAPATPPPARQPVESELQINPEKAKPFPQVADEKIGPYQKVATKVWFGKSFTSSSGTVGVGDIGYFDTVTQNWSFLHIPEMAQWSASALLVEPAAIWVGLIGIGDDGNAPGGLLRYDRATGKVTRIPLPDQIEKIVRVGQHLYCATSGGFAIIEQDHARRFEFSPQLDGSYTITPVT